MKKKYQITTKSQLLRDEASVKFHVKSDDYFGTIATVLNLLEQRLKKDSDIDTTVLNTTLKNLRDDLLFLQENYEIKIRPQIRPSAKNKKIIPKGKLISQ